MPLYKRKPFSLVEPPQDLKPHERVFQVRFTKEIYRDYQEYLNKLNLYRQRVWTCKVTGKTNLTYEEALISERRATEKVNQFPKELLAPVLHMIQYSTLSLKDLVNEISTKLQEHVFEGLELHAWKEQSDCACKILNILEDEDDIRYKVGWLEKNKKVTGTSIVNADDLIRKKPPFSRSILTLFIRESTSQSAPWVVHEKLARKLGIPTELPQELRDMLAHQNGCIRRTKEHMKSNTDRKNTMDARTFDISKKRKTENENMEGLDKFKRKTKKEEAKPKEVPVKYPIDDLIVRPAANDPVFTDRPFLSRDFGVPMDCVGDLLMVWGFCSSFSRLLHLWPFSLEDFENAICHKDSNLMLIVESHSAILRLLIKDEGEYFMAVQNKKRKSKITLTNWAEYLNDFLGMKGRPELSRHVETIKRGHYGLLDAHVKLDIFGELVAEALMTNAIRDKLDEYIEQQQTLAATNRDEARKKREEQRLTKEIDGGHVLVLGKGDLRTSADVTNCEHNEDVPAEGNVKVLLSNRNHILENGERKRDIASSRGAAKKLRMDGEACAEKLMNLSGIEESKKGQRRGKDIDKETQEKKPDEQQKDQLERELEKRFIRTNSLGKDRNYNRYWFFWREGRLFVESSDSKQWGYYTSKEELDALLGSLNPKGERERALQGQLEKHYPRISSALQKRSRDAAQRILLEEAVLRRSTRVRAQPRDGRAMAFLRYINKWKEN